MPINRLWCERTPVRIEHYAWQDNGLADLPVLLQLMEVGAHFSEIFDASSQSQLLYMYIMWYQTQKPSGSKTNWIGYRMALYNPLDHAWLLSKHYLPSHTLPYSVDSTFTGTSTWIYSSGFIRLDCVKIWIGSVICAQLKLNHNQLIINYHIFTCAGPLFLPIYSSIACV